MSTVRNCVCALGATLAVNAVAASQATPVYDFSVIHAFTGADGSCPMDALTRGPDGSWYGTTFRGGRGFANGTVFRIRPDGAFQTLHTFFLGSDNGAPRGVIFANDGNLYGVTDGFYYDNGPGVIYRVTPDGQYTVLHTFGPVDGPQPIIQGSDGALYGATMNGGGGSWNGGYVYRLALDGTFTVLHVFGNAYTDPWHPLGGLAEGQPGVFYGAANSGGDWGFGAVYSVRGDGSYATIHSFLRFGTDGQQPFSGPVALADGSIEGSTAYGTPYASGTIYKVDPTGAYSTVHTFATDGSEGIYPAGITANSRGVVYGTTTGGWGDGVLRSLGTVYRMKAGKVTVLHAFNVDGSEGSQAHAAPALAPNGDLVGAACAGGPSNAGTIYRLKRRP